MIFTGFNVIEEKLKHLDFSDTKKNKETQTFSQDYEIYVSKIGPRVKKILNLAKKLNILVFNVDNSKLNKLVQDLPTAAQEHRGIVLLAKNQKVEQKLDFNQCLKELAKKDSALVLILDSITDPHNVGAIIRSADQFGVNLVVIPENRSANDEAILARTSSGASSWVPIVTVNNLVRSVESLKDKGFWIYGADARGESLQKTKFTQKKALILGSEGTGIARLLKEKCDFIVSIPTTGKLDSLNVSVAAGIILYEINR